MKTKSPYLQYIIDYMLTKQYSLRTIETYLKWITSFIHFHQKRHPASMGDNEVEKFLEHLAVNQNVAARTHATALNSLAFLYQHIVEQPLSTSLNFARSSRQQKLPTVMTEKEVSSLLKQLTKRNHLVASILYGSGLRVREVINLRVQDIDFDFHCIRIWNGKGNKHRVVTLAKELVSTLRNQIIQR